MRLDHSRALMTWVSSVLACAAFAGSLAAQGRGGQIELGTFGSFTKYDGASLGLESKFGAGGRLALALSRVFSLEASGDFTESSATSTGASVDVARLGGTLFAHTRRIGFSTLYLGAGYERLFYSGAVAERDGGFHVILGDRLSLGGRAVIRVQGRATLYPGSPLQVAGDQVINFGGTFGLSIFAFGGPARDQDKDGVTNRGDRCPDTPLGAVVDLAGCPTDSDRDSVFDGLDECPGTPVGALIDSVGCPADADQDTVVDGLDVCPNTPIGAVADANGCPVDTDVDGVFDGLDQCPDTAGGATVDTVGCPLDSDADGVFDGLDQCEGTPQGVEVDGVGCPADADGDGVANALDQCPDTPAGTRVDATGCSLVVARDSDGDGVLDSNDRCPNTAPGQNVDGVGCPVLFVMEQGVARPLILQGVNFESGRSRLTSESHAVLDQVASSLVAHAEVRVEIAGHTDSTGSRSFNMRLSRARAQAVRAYLAGRGVTPSRMVAQGYGPDQPVAPNASPEGRAMNRRVELHLLDEQGQRQQD